eukprot:12422444-Karenia_brevis.AAC.1
MHWEGLRNMYWEGLKICIRMIGNLVGCQQKSSGLASKIYWARPRACIWEDLGYVLGRAWKLHPDDFPDVFGWNIDKL